MKIRKILMMALLGALVSFPALALDLQEARTAGMLGETTDGFVSVLTDGAGIAAFSKIVNEARKKEYQRISKANGQSVGVVAKLAAKQIISKLKSGSMYQDVDGKWVKK